ncbi:ChaN family lipoprotein [Magnetospirillum fulvum]|uniref:Haem-binding uptake Tiki superfamily ChaN domain-containing protein n=1 Tax=Magnetospirillum fulvum MGU-K5 TaxID=1316936 RepID=S9S9A0_MAGFU|nr:ChaN family lipoprotein [Magnetospirillum fulvum]EPY01274.1 hypothetical protein K678_11750 [Magnetospirillum fulvum MGU-K5]
MPFRVLLVLLMLPILSVQACSAPPTPVIASDHPLAGRIWQPATGRFLSVDELETRLASAQVVMLGETHDNPDHHALQAWAVRTLAAAGKKPQVAFEMIDRDRQADLDEAVHDLDGLGEALRWKERGWPDWPLYRPIAEAALAAGGTLSAANLPADVTRQIARRVEPAEQAARLGLNAPLPEAIAAALADEIRSSHCNMMPDSAIPGMVRVQRARDAEMAETVAALAQRPGPGPVVLIAGAGHARTDRGVPERLRQIAPGLTVFSLGLIETDAAVTDPAAEAPPFDAVWFTGRAEREDPCAQLMRQMKKKSDAAGK